MLTLELCFLIENLETEISALLGVSVKGNQCSVSCPPFFPHCKLEYNVSNLPGYKCMSQTETRILTFVTRCPTQNTVKPPVAAYQKGLPNHSGSLFGT